MSRALYNFANILFAGPCNLRCPYCIGRQVDPTLNRDNLGEFPLRNLDRFVALLREHAVGQLVFTGTTTDPQLYRHEASLIRWLRQRLPGVQFSLHTNGQLALKKIEVLNQYDRVSLSFPSFDTEIYERMTGSRCVPNLAVILRAAQVPVKVSAVVNEHNAGRIEGFLSRCHALGIRRVVLRRLYGDERLWSLPSSMRRAGSYRGNPVYDYRGMEVTWWDFERTTTTSLNLFSDGTISSEYLLIRAQGKGSSDTKG